MMKSLFMYRYGMIICCCMAFSQMARAQTDADALMIARNFYCAGTMYIHSDWKDYWEGTLKRDNANIGTLTTNTYTFFGNYGITNKLDVLFTVPYVTTNASAGTLRGQSGFQDLSLTLKWLAFQTKIGTGNLSAFAIATGTTPLSNYEADFDPMSIGLHSQTAALRGLVNYRLSRFFLAASAQYIRRSDITLDQTSYYTTELINSNRVDMPDANNVMVSTGYRSPHFNAEAMLEQCTTLGGFDIRRNDMPFPSNRMNSTMAGALFKYSFNSVAGLELTAGGNRVLKGRNVGQSTNIFGGVLYLFDFSKNKQKN